MFMLFSNLILKDDLNMTPREISTQWVRGTEGFSKNSLNTNNAHRFP